jgi:ATP adenylyltransferase
MKKTHLQYLWASWRMKYVQNEPKESGCVFCNALAQADGVENLIVARGKHSFVILNKFPYTSGHLMVTPLEHKASLEELEPAARAEIMELVSQSVVILRSVYHPEGFNVGINIGKSAGAGIPGHMHMHVVPRWGGDTNFMSTVGQTRVLPETPDETYGRIRQAWEQTQNS